jgi:hypothetical protein
MKHWMKQTPVYVVGELPNGWSTDAERIKVLPPMGVQAARVCLLYHVEEMTQREVAAKLGISPATVNRLLDAADAAFRRWKLNPPKRRTTNEGGGLHKPLGGPGQRHHKRQLSVIPSAA